MGHMANSGVMVASGSRSGGESGSVRLGEEEGDATNKRGWLVSE